MNRHPGDSDGHVVEMIKPKPEGPGFAFIWVLRAGMSNTDLKILQGYMGFHVVLENEFVGIVKEVDGDDEPKAKWVKKRVCGDINVGCTTCKVCEKTFDIE